MTAMMQIGIHGARRRDPRRRKRVSPARPGMAGRSGCGIGLGETDSRIDIGVKNIDEQVDAEDQHRLQDDHRLQ